MAVNICIVSNDNLRIVGLKYIMMEYFDMEDVHTYTSVDDIRNIYDLYITDTDTFSNKVDFFLQRRQKTIVFTDKSTSDFQLSTQMSLSEIVDSLKKILKDRIVSDETQTELSRREIEVLKLIAKGHLNKEIADKLNISINTVLSHRKNITGKLGIKSASGLSVYAMMHGFVK